MFAAIDSRRENEVRLRGLIAAVMAAAALTGAPALAHHDNEAQHHEAAAPGERAGDLVIEAAWARAPAGPNGAAYISVRNEGAEVDRLVGVSSDAAERVELHTTAMEDGVMRMRPVDAVEVHPGEPAVMQPGGNHIMMMGLTGELHPGDHFVVTLRFERAGKVPVLVEVMAPGASGPKMDGGHGHTH